MHELPLVFFTVLSQCAVGLALISFISNKIGLSDDASLRRANILVFILMLLAIFLSLLHLGMVFRAFNTLFNVGVSSFSNEIFTCAIFMAFVTITLVTTLYFAHYKKNTMLMTIANVVTLVVGVIFIYAITKVYDIPTVYNWYTPFTPMQMYATVVIGGGALAILTGSRTLGSLCLIFGAIFVFAFKPYYFKFLADVGSSMLANDQFFFWMIEFMALGLGIAGAVYCMFSKNTSNFIPSLIAIVILIGELSSRVAFYNLWSIPM